MKCFIVQNPITNGIGSVEYLEGGVDALIQLIDQIVVQKYTWTEEAQTRAGIAAWDCGLFGIPSHEAIDVYTTGHDFSSDIFARAQFFANNGY